MEMLGIPKAVVKRGEDFAEYGLGGSPGVWPHSAIAAGSGGRLE